ncbi:MAG: hypothetical protein V1672_03025, partial [Candidatus Diapherotrites archaeon]
MSRKIFLIAISILLISLSVSALNYCKTAPDNYSIFYPAGFNKNNIPDNVSCWCSPIDSTTGNPPDIFEADAAGSWLFGGSGFGTLALPGTGHLFDFNPFNFVILKNSQRFGWTYDVPINTTLNINHIKKRAVINAQPYKIFDWTFPIINTVSPPVEVEIRSLSGQLMDTVKNSYACSFGASCYNYGSRQRCEGSADIPSAYHFTALGTYIIKIYAYTTNDADPDSRVLAADFRVRVVSNYVDGTPPYETPVPNFCRDNTLESGEPILPMGVYYPSDFNPLGIPSEKQCWCNQNTKLGAREAIKNVTFAELVPSANYPDQKTIQISKFDYNGEVFPGTVLNIKNIGTLPNIYSQVYPGAPDNMLVSNIVPGVDVIVWKLPDEIKVMTKHNSPDCTTDLRQSCYNVNPSHQICIGKTEIPNAYTFNELGDYIVWISPYRLNNGDQRSAKIAATLHITVTEPPVKPPVNPCANEFCGNGKCSAACGENATTCPADCVADPCANEFCGNGICNASCKEDKTTCPADCPMPPVIPPAPVQGTLVISNSNPHRIIEVNNDSDEVTILWTLTNVGDSYVDITSVGPFGCNADWTTPGRVGTCAFPESYSGYRIPAKTTFRVFEKIKITDYSKIPNTELFGLSVTYIPKGANNEK